jgi:hypothetical protein
MAFSFSANSLVTFEGRFSRYEYLSVFLVASSIDILSAADFGSEMDDTTLDVFNQCHLASKEQWLGLTSIEVLRGEVSVDVVD